MTAPKLLTVPQVAERLGVSDDTVRNLVARGRISHVRVGFGAKKARIRFTDEDVAAFIARNRKPSADDDAAPAAAPRQRRSHAHLDLPEAQRYVG